MALNSERWTVIATKTTGTGPFDRWCFEPGYNARNVSVAVDTGRLITLHKRVDAGWHLVAKLPMLAKAKR